MNKTLCYTIFKTDWGYFGLAGTDKVLLRTHLPAPDPQKLKSRLLSGLDCPRHDPHPLKPLQKQIIAYFQGRKVNFTKAVPLNLDRFTPFERKVLAACRNIKFGQTANYAALADEIGHPNSARAVANVLAKNPMPLIIPCHRIIRSDGQTGGFSAPGGKKLKKSLLNHEKTVCFSRFIRKKPASQPQKRHITTCFPNNRPLYILPLRINFV
ncbi:MAG: methylated-DNA--[protein]-cysteine S-methyltransferase [Planctomycetes bacterium]|nr:methylated-DNA--[protein]-cysteine S-methyltransferase [Planctomycetota bacterium]